MCNRGDQLFESSSSSVGIARDPSEFERLVSKSIMDNADDAYVTKKGVFSKRSAADESRASPQPPKKKLKEAADAESLNLKKPASSDTSSEPTETKEGVSIYESLDVLCGRGGGTNLHEGNRFYRDLILSHRTAYDDATKAMKPEIAREIVQRIRERGGRFLRRGKDGLYYDIGDAEAKAKTSQALRHRTFELRNTKDPDRVKMNGRWKPSPGADGTKQRSSKSPSPNGASLDRLSPSTASMLAMKAMAPSLQASSTSSTASSATAVNSNLLQEALRRQQVLEASRNSNFPSGGSDAAYMNALANLKHQETMLNLDRAIHEAEKRRYVSMAASGTSTFPSNLSGNLPFGRSTSTSLNPMLSPLNRGLFQVGSLARQLSLGSGSPLGGGIRDQASFLPLGRIQRMNSNPASVQQQSGGASQEAKSPGSPAKKPAAKGDE